MMGQHMMLRHTWNSCQADLQIGNASRHVLMERQTVRQTKRERGLQLCIDTKMNRLIKRQTEPQRDRFAPSQNDRQTDRQTDRKKDVKTKRDQQSSIDRQMNRDRQTLRQTDQQKDK